MASPQVAHPAEQVAQFRAAGGIGRFEFGQPNQAGNRIAIAAHRQQQPGELTPELRILGSEMQPFLKAENGGLEIPCGGQPFRQGQPALAGVVVPEAPHPLAEPGIWLLHGLLPPGGKVGGVAVGWQGAEPDETLQGALDQHRHYRPLGCRQAAFPPCWTSACCAMTRS